ncbi:MAG: TonB family protein [Acidobacteria bacterium]|nr:TonB family protein [Acidobacteriota bacterium]
MPVETPAEPSDLDIAFEAEPVAPPTAEPEAPPAQEAPAASEETPAADDDESGSPDSASEGSPFVASYGDGPIEPMPSDLGLGEFRTQKIATVGPGRVDPQPGQSFGHYMLLERIAVGGMAEVWKARMESVAGFRKTVAIKKILPQLTENQEFERMFVDEAKLAAELNHPNIIHIYDLGEIHNEYYIAMEYVEGKDLRSLLNTSQRKAVRLPRELALHIALKLASALDYAHRKRDAKDNEMGLVHRDVSPQNVLISYEGEIKLCDFGIVKAVSKSSKTQMGALKGKLQYMSPEQAWGQEVDARADIFALGAILFEMLTGERLFDGDSELSVLEAVRNGHIRAPREVDPGIPEEVDRLVQKAVAKEPVDRFQTAGQMREEIESVLEGLNQRPGTGDVAAFLRRLKSAPVPVDEGEGSAAGISRTASSASHPRSSSAVSSPPTGTGSQPSAIPVVADDAAAGGTGTGVAAAAGAAAPSDTGAGIGSVGTGTGGGAVPLDHEGPLVPVTPEPPPAAEATPVDEEPTPATPPPPEDDGSLLVHAVPPSASDAPAPAKKGRGALWIALAVIALLLVALVIWWTRGSSSSSGATDETPASAPAEDTPSPQAAPELPTEGEAGAEAPATPQAPAAATNPDSAADERAQLEKAAAEQLARQEAELRRQYEEKEKSIQQELDRLAALEAESAAEESKTAPAAAEQGKPPETRPSDAKPADGQQAGAKPAVGAAETTGAAAGGASAEPVTSAPPAQQQAVAQPAKPQQQASQKPPAAVAVPETKAPPPPPAAPTVREGELVEPGAGVSPPVLVSIDEPKYPPIARRARVEGDVILSLLVDETGRVKEVKVVQGARSKAGLNEAAIEAARTARFKPASKDGVRVRMWATLKIPFRL